MPLARIEIAEVLSFQLTVPGDRLPLLVDELKSELPLTLEAGRRELVVSTLEGQSALRFRYQGETLALEQIILCNDRRGAFFQHVLIRLMVEFRGDLRARLVWNDSDRNIHGGFVEVAIRRGRAQDGLSGSVAMVPGPDRAAHSSAFLNEQAELEALLRRARADWSEYLRLKTGGRSR